MTFCRLTAASFEFAGSDDGTWVKSSLAWSAYEDSATVLHSAGGPISLNQFSDSVSGKWQIDGIAQTSLQALTSPQFTALTTSITLDIIHTYDYGNEADFDGGRAEYSTDNGSTWSILTMTGYGTLSDLFGNPLTGGYAGGPASSSAWTGSDSATHTGTFTAGIGDNVRIRFTGGWDIGFIGGTTPNWTIESVTVSNVTVVPEPHEYAMVAGLGLLGFAVFRRIRAKASAA